jgi:hypothetical protein
MSSQTHSELLSTRNLRGPPFDSHAIHREHLDDPAENPRYARWRTESAEQFA